MLTLTHGKHALTVAPEHGGAIAGWRFGATPVLRNPSPEAVVAGQPGAMGCFPLLPYCNRIANGKFRWDGRDYAIRRNFGDHPHAIHGIGWQRRWTVLQIRRDAVSLGLNHAADDAWPFSFEATLTYALTDAGLTVSIAATNRHATDAPMGIGLHPYFPRAPGRQLRFEAGGVWFNDSNALPQRHGPVPPDWDHAQPRGVGSVALDNCFTGWTGAADIGGATISADGGFANLQVFTPDGGDFFCVEPVSHAPDAIARPELPADQAMRRLGPGETAEGVISILAH